MKRFLPSTCLARATFSHFWTNFAVLKIVTICVVPMGGNEWF